MTREQFIALVKSEQEALRGFLLALCCGKRDDADDIAQETLVKAYLSSSAYRDKGMFRAWLFTIARNTFPQPQGKQAHVRRHLCSTQRGVSNVSRLRLPPSGAVHGARHTLAQGALCSGDVLHERLLGEGDSRHHRLHHKRREAATLARQRQP